MVNNRVIADCSPLEAANEYLGRGFAPLPTPRAEKAPRITNWTTLQLTENDLPAHFSDSPNVGIILGEISGGLVDVDLDCAEAISLADSFLPRTEFVFGRASKPQSHRFYIADPLPAPHKFSAPDKLTLLELRGKGQQTLVPPSIHPSGELYQFERDGKPTAVDGAELLRCVGHLGAAVLLVLRYPAQGQRHDAMLALCGMLLRAHMTKAKAETFISAVAIAAGDEETRVRVRNVVSTAERLAAGKPATGAPTLAAIIGDEVVRRVSDWLGLNSQLSEGSYWPEPASLGDELPPVAPFDPELLPSSLRPLVEDISDRMQAPADFAATAAIVTLAGCVNRRAFIIPKKDDTTWRVTPNLWGAIVAPPGMMKSPILQAITHGLGQIEQKWRSEFESACSDFQLEKEQLDLRYQAWREEYKRAVKKGETLPAQPDKTLCEPIQKRLVLTDATFEKLHEILSQNAAGVLVVRDELTGWLSELSRLGREGERAFFLQAWNGDSGFTVDRIGRGSIHVPHVCVSLIGNIQPAKLRTYLSDTIEGGPTDDGLFQRFQILVWPDLPRGWTLVDRPADESAQQKAELIFSILAELPTDPGIPMRFDSDAQELFFAWWSNLESKIRQDSGLAPAFIAHLAKYRSLMPSLAGLFELADRVAGGEDLSGEVSVSLEHTKQAAAFCDYLESHARRAYACIISPETRSAREFMRHIQAGDLGEKFSTREIYRHGWGALDTPERVRTAISFLEDLGWLRRHEEPASASGGRPTEVWLVNPKGVSRA